MHLEGTLFGNRQGSVLRSIFAIKLTLQGALQHTSMERVKLHYEVTENSG